MIYYILYELIYGHFKDRDWFLVKGLNVFQYVTFRTAYASVTALLMSLFFGRTLINGLKKWNIGQQIREEGPQGHIAKRDTPTMGGLLIIASVIISTLLWSKLSGLYVWLTILATLAFGAVGFVDDYLKLVKRRSLGLTGRQKLLFQLIIALLVWLALFISTQYFQTKYSWNVSIPFFKATAVTEPSGVTYRRSLRPRSPWKRVPIVTVCAPRSRWTGCSLFLEAGKRAQAIERCVSVWPR